MDVASLVRRAIEEGQIAASTTNRRAQFGTRTQPNVLASVLPERLVPENGYREAQIRYRTMVANDGTRYSPAQKKRGAITGWMDVILHDQDVADEFTSADHDALVGMLGAGRDVQAMSRLVGWFDTVITRPLTIKSELQRWQAVVNAKVIRTGDNNLYEEIAYSNPAGHRVAAGGSFADPLVDPMDMIQERVEFQRAKGYPPRRCWAPSPIIAAILRHPKVKATMGRSVFTADGGQIGIPGPVTLADFNARLAADGIPAIERHDQQYNTMTGSRFFLDRNTMVWVCTTGRNEDVELGDGNIETLDETLGYTGIGRAAGQGGPGRVGRAEAFDNKPPRVEAEGWQTSAPVILDPEAISTLHTIATT